MRAAAEIVTKVMPRPRVGSGSKALFEKPHEPRCQQTRRSGLAVERVGGPVMLGMGQYHRVHGKVGLSQHLRKGTRVQFFADDIISGAPGQKERDVVRLRVT